MILRRFIVFSFLLLSGYLNSQTIPSYVENYLEKYKNLAISEMLKHGIPASITLAQGILESNYGKSLLAIKANNHFGIKCRNEWKGPVFYKNDEGGCSCYRKYKTVEQSYEDRSLFLKSKPWYSKLFTLPVYDYRGWAFGLKKAGYATDPNYAYLIINIIERYQLYKYDFIGITMN